MAKRKKFRIRSKPKKPKRQILRESTDLYDGMSVQDILDQIVGPPSAAILEIAYWYDDCSVSVNYRYEELDEQYQARLDIYESKLETYNQWYDENCEAIEEELRLREIEEKEAIEKRKEKELARARKDLANLQKKIERMKR